MTPLALQLQLFGIDQRRGISEEVVVAIFNSFPAIKQSCGGQHET